MTSPYLLLAWAVSLTATLGSLFFSEVMRLPPCSLCWYQRIALFPLALILLTGIVARDRNVTKYAWPFVGIGLALAGYHNLLELGIISEELAPCSMGVSCKAPTINWFGFTIPRLSLLAFVAIGVFLWASRSVVKEVKNDS